MKDLVKKILPREKNARVLLLFILACFFIFGWLIGSFDKTTTHQDHQSAAIQDGETTIWTCSMHPQIRQPKPGKCPICGMDLIPVSSEKKSDNPRQIYLRQFSPQIGAD